jgi:HECT-domain (ubiquitin-transferase)
LIRLAQDRAIIVERPRYRKQNSVWSLARVVGFDKVSGSHSIVRMLDWRDSFVPSVVCLDDEDRGSSLLESAVYFDPVSIKVILRTREYYVVGRKKTAEALSSGSVDISMETDDTVLAGTVSSAQSIPSIGSRVESNCGGAWNVYTLVGVRPSFPDKLFINELQTDYQLDLVSDEGELFSNVASSQLKTSGGTNSLESNRLNRRSTREERAGVFPFFESRSRYEIANTNPDTIQSSRNREKALKRNWSALALADALRPIDLKVPPGKQTSGFLMLDSQDFSWDVRFGDKSLRITASQQYVEVPTQWNVYFSVAEKMPCLNIYDSTSQTTIRYLRDLYTKQANFYEWPPKAAIKLFFSLSKGVHKEVVMQNVDSTNKMIDCRTTLHTGYDMKVGSFETELRTDNRSRKLSSRSMSPDNDSVTMTVCDGIDELCMQCMEIISLLSECAENSALQREKDDPSLTGFASTTLSKKLTDQLEDPLCVVGGALPDWCLAATSFAPRAFTYDSRRALLERAAYGVSRSTFRQQEARINVAKLRQRMASLRARAVELVGEAFSGGAEDPTALQLQADELYGMEEALATRVRASFRAAMWQEHSLQVAKASVRREFLLNDATVIMDRYANDPLVCRRRLEVRFDGESGFDAASGDEAGVTRGFYADVAEALLSADIIANITCSSQCSPGEKQLDQEKSEGDLMEDTNNNDNLKLPLWIPDFDSSSAVVIPTPRADKRSSLGIYPRPIPSYHPQMSEVLAMFRLIGRLFASAMRDGFMFPLPLSSAFLKLVLYGKLNPCFSPLSENFGGTETESPLSSNDLPRPGFLGGEIYAAEYYVCRVLDDLDSLNPPLSQTELKRRYEDVENDNSFGRVALGKSYDLSFKEYFEEKTFVDPLDPSQGMDAHALCPKGHLKPVTVYNIREWVTLAKSFFVHDGIINQAIAFRRGVEDFFSVEFLRLFTPVELQRDVCGTGGDVDNWDEGIVRKLFKLDGKYFCCS